mgnify:CR=1 FL=1
MASAAEAIFIPIFAILIFGFAVLAIALTPKAEAEFALRTTEELSEVKVQTVTSTFFQQKNNNGITNFKSVSYELCDGSGTYVSNGFRNDYNLMGMLNYMEIKYSGIPSQCGSSGYTQTRFTGSDDRNNNFYYNKRIPVIGGDVVNAQVVYEIR